MELTGPLSGERRQDHRSDELLFRTDLRVHPRRSGADVIKVEAPGGDLMCRGTSIRNGISASFGTLVAVHHPILLVR
jgi:hypothetical protein